MATRRVRGTSFRTSMVLQFHVCTVAVKVDPVKEEPKLRPSIDLSRRVNKCTRVSHAKLDNLPVAQERISKDNYLASFDLANQFFHVCLHEADKMFFGFEVKLEDLEDQNTTSLQ
jgi:hypothetical protein